MLTPCCQCLRHVRSGDDACPFCGAPAPTPVPGPLGFGRAARAAAGAFALSTAIAGCKEEVKPEPVKPAGSAPVVTATPSVAPSVVASLSAMEATVASALASASAALSASASASASVPPRPTVTAVTAVPPASTYYKHPNTNKPYGAPPADGLLV